MSAALGPAAPQDGGRAVRVLYFAWLRERVGHAEELLDLPQTVTDVAGLTAWLRGRDAAHAAAFEHPGIVRCAVNQRLASSATQVAAGDEVAFFPPVTGG